jgi:triphosphatase
MQHCIAMSGGEPSDNKRADAAALQKQTSVADAFAQIAACCLRDFRRTAPKIRTRHDAEDVHKSRIAIRRLRAAFSIFKPALLDTEFENLSTDLRELGHALGEVRDIDVVHEHVDVHALRTELAKMSAAARKRLVKILFSRRMEETFRHLDRWRVSGGWRNENRTDFDTAQPAEAFAANVLERRFKRLKKRGRHLSAMTEDELHRFRILVKKLRYGAEFFAPLYGTSGKSRRFVKRMTRLQDHLGYITDAETAERILAPLVTDPGAIRHKRREKKEIARAEDVFEDILSLKPFWR